METKALKGKAAGSDTNASFGFLDQSEQDISGTTPRVVSILSSVLERSIKKNEKLFKVSSKQKDVVTVFHGVRPPNISIQQYIERIFKYSSCSTSCFVSAYIYIERFLQRTATYLTSLNVHRLLITSIVVASKFVDNEGYDNAYFAKIGGISIEEMNRMEMKFLFNLDFRLVVTPEVFGKYCLQLEKEGVRSTGKTIRLIPLV